MTKTALFYLAIALCLAACAPEKRASKMEWNQPSFDELPQVVREVYRMKYGIEYKKLFVNLDSTHEDANLDIDVTHGAHGGMVRRLELKNSSITVDGTPLKYPTGPFVLFENKLYFTDRTSLDRSYFFIFVDDVEVWN